MTDGNPSRFRVVGGTETDQPEAAPAFDGAVTKPSKPRKPRAKRPPMKDQLTPWHCAACTEEQLGFEQHKMVQILRAPHEANGKLICGSIWWACARCLKPVYLVREFGEKR
jgi:hypothetical protein